MTFGGDPDHGHKYGLLREHRPRTQKWFPAAEKDYEKGIRITLTLQESHFLLCHAFKKKDMILSTINQTFCFVLLLIFDDKNGEEEDIAHLTLPSHSAGLLYLCLAY